MRAWQSVGLLVMLMACWFFVPKVTADLISVVSNVFDLHKELTHLLWQSDPELS